MKRKSKIFFIVIFSFVFLLSLPGCNDGTGRSNPFGKEINQKAKRIYKNGKGFWEAEFAHGTIMVQIPAGEFTMGSNDRYDREKPVHKVYLDEYWIGKYEVTNEEYKKFIDEGGCNNKDYWTKEGWKWLKDGSIIEPANWHDSKWNGTNFPVVGVSWFEASAYAFWLSKKTGLKFRLSTEAEWEKAARSTDGREYPWGNKFDKNKCNSDESGLGKTSPTSPVGKCPEGVSPYGCLDMAGNVWEWCSDWYKGDYYKDSPSRNPEGPSNGFGRVFRGGSWVRGAIRCRASFRYSYHPANRWAFLGFRLAGSL